MCLDHKRQKKDLEKEREDEESFHVISINNSELPDDSLFELASQQLSALVWCGMVWCGMVWYGVE